MKYLYTLIIILSIIFIFNICINNQLYEYMDNKQYRESNGNIAIFGLPNMNLKSKIRYFSENYYKPTNYLGSRGDLINTRNYFGISNIYPTIRNSNLINQLNPPNMLINKKASLPPNDPIKSDNINNYNVDTIGKWFRSPDFYMNNYKYFHGINPVLKPGISRYTRMQFDRKTPFGKYKFLDGLGFKDNKNVPSDIYGSEPIDNYFISHRIWNRPYQSYDYINNMNDDQVYARIKCGKLYNHILDPQEYNNCIFKNMLV